MRDNPRADTTRRGCIAPTYPTGGSVNCGMRRRLILAIAMVGASTGHAWGRSPGDPNTESGGAPSQPARVPGEYIVTLATPGEVKAIADLYGRFGIRSIKQLGSSVFLVTLSEDPGPATMETLRRENAHIKAVEPNFVYRVQEGGTSR
jgi:hypothetical protein